MEKCPSEVFDDLLAALTAERRVHSRAVGAKALSQVQLVGPHLRADLIVAATLHDIGYAHVQSGLHALDGARFLAANGFNSVVCNLVLHHSASTYEAAERGIDKAVFAEFTVKEDLRTSHAVLWWADLTTGPLGEDVTVEERLNEISLRYGAEDVITRFVNRARGRLVSAGQTPIGSIQVPG